MSIRSTIAALEAAGELTSFHPRSRIPPRRRLYLNKQAVKDLTDVNSATNVLVGRGYIQAALEHWVRGERVTGTAKGGRFMKRLESPPKEIWEIRVTVPVVQCRLFGRFAEQDTLVLTKFHTRSMLGKKGSANWTSAMTTCETDWGNLFGLEAPYTGNSIHDYVSENCDDFPLEA
tara:strand:- start:21 stop:545 length:525 start_codon:yes stop_codon:yes gene_type:complete